MKWTSEDLKKLKNRAIEGDLSPGALASKYGSKDAVMQKANEIMDFLNKSAPNPKLDPKAFEEWSSAKNIIKRNFETGIKYAPTIKKDSPFTNLDELNEKEYVKVSAESPSAKLLEKGDSAIDPYSFKRSQIVTGSDTPVIEKNKLFDLENAKRKALLDMSNKTSKSALKSVSGALPLVGAAMAFSGAREAGASVPEAIAKAAQEEVTNPIIDALLPSNISEEKSLSPEDVARYQAEMKAMSDEARAKSQERQANALEFGEKLNEMQNIKKNTLKRMSERQ